MYNTDTILTERESQVVLGYVRGCNGKEIADKCCMAYRTVVNHTQNAFDKADCQRSVHALVSWWYRTNFPEIARQISTACLLVLFSISVYSAEGEYLRSLRSRTRVNTECRARFRRARTDESFEFEVA